MRVEQLYPFPVPEMEAVLAKYPNAREVVWCQEEPQNQGAWYQIRHRLATLVGKRELLYAGRAPAAAPATGISKIHEAEQRGLIEAALTATNKEDGARETKRLTSTPGAGSCRHVAISQLYGKTASWPSKSRFRNCPSRWPMPRWSPGTSRSGRP